MTTLSLVTRSIVLRAGEEFGLGDGHHAVAVNSGAMSEATSPKAAAGAYFGPQSKLCCEQAGRFVVFSLQEAVPAGALLSVDPIEINAPSAVFRLDQIDFPPGAIAYRHVHAGPGTRYLTKGSLEVASDHGAEVMLPGAAWFEGANSPVRATASATQDTAFIRATLLPLAYLGKPSIKYLNTEDDDKPRLQTNTRHFEKVIELGV